MSLLLRRETVETAEVRRWRVPAPGSGRWVEEVGEVAGLAICRRSDRSERVLHGLEPEQVELEAESSMLQR